MAPRARTLCGRALDGVLHVCAFVESGEHARELLLPFLQEGGAQGDRLLTIVGPDQRDAHDAWSRQHGLPRHLQLTWAESFLPDGRFSSAAALDLLERHHLRAQLDGFGGLRGFADMAWAHQAVPGGDQLLHYEAQLNDVLGRYHDALVCVYDANACSSRLMSALMAAHPKVVLEGRLHENRYWEPVAPPRKPRRG